MLDSITKSFDVPKATAECKANLEFMASLPDGYVRLVVTSPPYNIGKSYEKRAPLDIYLDGQRQVIAECVRILADGGSICWQVGNYVDKGEVVPLDILFYPIFKEFGLKLRNRIVWHYEHGLHCSNRFSGRHETILWFTKGDNYGFELDPVRVPSKYPEKKYFRGPRAGQLSGNPLGKNPGDVWAIPNVKHNHVEKTAHPCQYPVELVERLVLSMTEPGDRVLDPYMGSGSTLVAAVKHGREGLGCDTDPAFVEIARERLSALDRGDLRTRPMNRAIYNPSLPRGGASGNVTAPARRTRAQKQAAE